MREREQLEELQRRHAIFSISFTKRKKGRGAAEVGHSLLFFSFEDAEAEGVGGEC